MLLMGLKIILVCVLSYLFGSVPVGLIISQRMRKIDIRDYGSGNIGATNVARTIGLKWGIIVFLLDFAKGFLAVWQVFYLFNPGFNWIGVISILAAILAISGHNWPLFLGFKGGKGVSTSIGVISALAANFAFLRIPVIAVLSVWLIAFALTRIVAVASMLAALSFLIICLVLESVPAEFKALSFILAVFIVARHKKNIRELKQKLAP